jgi:signal transduction histidine kinase/ligand-binding sensor domain-containing protein
MKNQFTYKLGILIILMIPFFQVFGQPTIFNKVLPPDGKSFVTVEGIVQDADGFMWFASKTGLYKYDGYQFINFKHNPSDANSLITDSLTKIVIDNSGKIWIGTMGYGLECFNPATGQIKHYRPNPDVPGNIKEGWIGPMLVDSDGILWIGANGLYRYIKETDSFVLYQNISGDTTSLSNNAVNTIYEDKQGTIWVGTGEVWNEEEDSFERGGLNRLNKKTGTFTRFMHNPNNPNSLINNKVSTILEDSKGTFWVGTAGDGLHTMDREKGTFVRHTYDPKHPEKLSRPPFNKLSEEYQLIEFITFIQEDATGAIWIGTLHAGINYYDPETRKTTYLESSKYFYGDYDGGTTWQSYSSRDGIVWISSLTGFLYRIDPQKKQIPHYTKSNVDFMPLYEDPNGVIWGEPDEGLVRIDKVNGTAKRVVIDVNPLITNPNYIFVIKPDRQGNVLIGTSEGLAQWDKKTDRFIHYIIPGGPIWSIFEEDEANLWVGNDNGLSLINRKTDSINHYLIYPNNNATSNKKNSVSSILVDKTGKLWAGTWYGGGLNLFNKETKTFKTYFKEYRVACIYEDSDGNLWAASVDGLYKYSRSSDQFNRLTYSSKSLGISHVRSIIEDNQKYLWLGTKDGIVRINPQRNGIKVYGKDYGITENSLGWNSVFKGRNGELYFGDESGYFTFDPEELIRNLIPPQISFTRFLLADKPIVPDKDGPLKESLSIAQEVRLNFNQNVFTFEFAAIDYSNPEENQHFYMLENYDIDWRNSNSERKAYYFNVPPGKYVFRVKAVTSNGAWAEKKIDVIILPPWWKTWWAYCIYGLLFIALVFGIDRFQRQRLLKAEKERNRERELAQAKEIEKAYTKLKSTQSQLIQSEKMASLGELTAGIAHEIQNPLNFVNNFSEVSNELIVEIEEERAKNPESRDENQVSEILSDIKQNLIKINHHGKRAADIVRGMLQHSRTSSGLKEPTDINALADEYLRLAYHGLRAKDKSFNAEFKTEFDESLPKINVIPQDIGRVLLNLINNAFYAAPLPPEGGFKDPNYIHKPTVTVRTSSFLPPTGGPRGALISVIDNGPGIPPHIIDKIFQPFFTTKPTGQGTGLGLSLAYDIVKAHGGELKVETKEGEGTEFIIQLPIN